MSNYCCLMISICIMCTKGIPCRISINPLDWHLDWYSVDILINTQLTLNQHLIDSRLIVHWLTCIDWKLVHCWLSSMESLMECQSSVNRCVDAWMECRSNNTRVLTVHISWGYQWTLDCSCLYYTWSRKCFFDDLQPSHSSFTLNPSCLLTTRA